jgi:uncharacterized membrane protein YphA (DoxX/SURF4 family)
MATRIEGTRRDTVIAPAPRIPHIRREAAVWQTRHGAGISRRRRTGEQDRHGVRTAARSHTIALAGLQLLLGYEWLVSGVDKLLYADFPGALGRLLAGTLQSGHIPAPFAALLRALVLSHSAAFGVLVEWGETLAGLGLIVGALVALLAPRLRGRLAPAAARWLALGERAMAWLAPAAALATALMGLSFYLLDGAPSQWPMPSVAFGGALDTGLMLALGSAVLLADATSGSRASQRVNARQQAPKVVAKR